LATRPAAAAAAAAPFVVVRTQMPLHNTPPCGVCQIHPVVHLSATQSFHTPNITSRFLPLPHLHQVAASSQTSPKTALDSSPVPMAHTLHQTARWNGSSKGSSKGRSRDRFSSKHSSSCSRLSIKSSISSQQSMQAAACAAHVTLQAVQAPALHRTHPFSLPPPPLPLSSYPPLCCAICW